MSFTVEALKTYSFEIDYDKKYKTKENKHMAQTYTKKEADDIIYEKTKAYAEKKDLTFEEAFPIVLKQNPELADAYIKGKSSSDEGELRPDQELDAKVWEVVRNSNYQLNYVDASELVRQDPSNADLLKRYAGV